MSAEITEQTTPRRRGRPPGSKTKNRIKKDEPLSSDASVLVPAPTRRPMHYNRVEAAAELGISHAFLYQKAGEEGGIYLPAHQEGRYIIYTETQIRIISMALRGKIAAEKGRELWERIDDRELTDMARRGGGTPS